MIHSALPSQYCLFHGCYPMIHTALPLPTVIRSIQIESITSVSLDGCQCMIEFDAEDGVAEEDAVPLRLLFKSIQARDRLLAKLGKLWKSLYQVDMPVTQAVNL